MPMPATVFAVDVGGTKIAAAIIDGGGKVVARSAEPIDTSRRLAPVKQIVRLARQLSGGKHKFSAAGIAIPGLVRRNGTVWAPNIPGWEKIPLARLLHKQLKVPVAVESDRNAAVLGEAWKGAAKGKSDVVVLIVGTGIGAGILSGGRLIRGAHELSGCAGWMAVSEADGFEVRKFGGLEAFCSGPGVVRAAKNAIDAGFGGSLAEYEPELFTAEDIATLARQGDLTAKNIFRRTGRQLGLAVANLISLFDPEVVVFGGGLAGASDLFWKELTETALERSQPLAAKQVRITLSKLGAQANLLGAAKCAWDMLADEKERRPRARARPARH